MHEDEVIALMRRVSYLFQTKHNCTKTFSDWKVTDLTVRELLEIEGRYMPRFLYTGTYHWLRLYASHSTSGGLTKPKGAPTECCVSCTGEDHAKQTSQADERGRDSIR